MALPKIDRALVPVVNTPMCDDLGCPSRKNCFRHAASGRIPRAEKQPYFAEPTRTADEDSCPWYWPLILHGFKKPKVRQVTVVREYTIRNDPKQVSAFISINDVAKMLCCSPQTVKNLTKRDDLNFPQPFNLAGRIRYWLRTDIENFLKDEGLRGWGSQGRHAWKGGNDTMPAYPWVHTATEGDAEETLDAEESNIEEDDEDEQLDDAEGGGEADAPFPGEEGASEQHELDLPEHDGRNE
jgi:predicted DNA-binding transcriptional regulator AlpA